MNLEIDPIEENATYEAAKKWLNQNGTFTHSEKGTRSSLNLNATFEKITFTATFQKNGSAEIASYEGDDLKKLTIRIYQSEQ